MKFDTLLLVKIVHRVYHNHFEMKSRCKNGLRLIGQLGTKSLKFSRPQMVITQE